MPYSAAESFPKWVVVQATTDSPAPTAPRRSAPALAAVCRVLRRYSKMKLSMIGIACATRLSKRAGSALRTLTMRMSPAPRSRKMSRTRARPTIAKLSPGVAGLGEEQRDRLRFARARGLPRRRHADVQPHPVEPVDRDLAGRARRRARGGCGSTRPVRPPSAERTSALRSCNPRSARWRRTASAARSRGDRQVIPPYRARSRPSASTRIVPESRPSSPSQPGRCRSGPRSRAPIPRPRLRQVAG